MNPYEIARLAGNRGVGTAEFRARFTPDGEGLHLARTEDGACVFSARRAAPFIPTARWSAGLSARTANHRERRRELRACQSRILCRAAAFTRGAPSRIFLRRKKSMIFIQAADDYFSWFCRARDAMAEAGEGDSTLTADANELARYGFRDCRPLHSDRRSSTLDIEERRRLHLAILDPSSRREI